MIDTWVGPDYSTFYYVYDDAENGQCDMKAESYGRGIFYVFIFNQHFVHNSL